MTPPALTTAAPILPSRQRTERLLERAILIRRVEERLLDLYSRGALFGTVHTCIGQELTGLAVAEFLRPGDYVFSNHRCHGHFLAQTDDVEGLIAEVMGKETGVCGGRGGSQHLCQDGFFSNGIQGGIVPVAAGLACAQKLRNDDHLTVVFIGDGTLGEGAVYETLNLASKWDLPLLVVVENNLYSQSTRQSETLAGEICARGAAFGIETFHTHIWDVEELVGEVGRAMTLVREQNRPAFLQIDAYRLAAHSKGDDDRSPDEVFQYRQRDPIHRFFTTDPRLAQQASDEAGARIDAAVAAAEQAPDARPLPAVGSHVATELHWTIPPIPTVPIGETRHPPERCVTLIRDGLDRALERDERVVLIGEDIESPYGGAFKATKGLSQKYPDRVRNMPISESLIIGLGNGLALAGMVPVCEIMFADFLTLGADQLINHASKFRSMYNDQVRVPLVVRTPVGGRRGYGPTHSQSLEKHFLGLPDTSVLALNHRLDPGLLYDLLFARIEQPTLVLENKVLYGQRVSAEMPEGFALEFSNELFPTTRIRPEGTADVTIVCYGEMLREVEEAVLTAFDEHEIIAEVICPTRIYPLGLQAILDSVGQTGRLLVVEEGIGFAGFGAEVLAQVAERIDGPSPRMRRLAAPEHPIPASAHLEKAMLPHAATIVAAIRDLAHG